MQVCISISVPAASAVSKATFKAVQSHLICLQQTKKTSGRASFRRWSDLEAAA